MKRDESLAERRMRINGVNGFDLLVRGSHARKWSDIYYYVLISSWRRLLALLALFYLVVNVLFACLYLAGGDVIDHATPGSFLDAFFFSIQTWATIGYGLMAPKTRYADILVGIEAFCGMLSMSVVTGLVFAKFARPVAKVRFTKHILISRFDGKPTLLFRLGNLRLNQILEARLRVVFTSETITAEGVRFRKMVDLPLVRDTTILFSLTWLAMHEIDENSPFYGATDEMMRDKKMQLVVSMTGHDEEFNQTVHARHVYRYGDIVRGVRFEDMLMPDGNGGQIIDYNHFDRHVAL